MSTRIRAAARWLRELPGDHWSLLAAAAALVIVGWTLPAGDRFGYVICLAVGIPWALLVLGPRGDER